MIYDQELATVDNARTVVTYADIYQKNKIYMGPRKDNAAVSAEFTYGDGKYLILFHYTKDSKASLRGNATAETHKQEDKGNKKTITITVDPNAKSL